MQIMVTLEEEVRLHSPINRKKYKGCPWESRKDNLQMAKDKDQKDSPWAGMSKPHPHTDTVGGND
jgi:hypothetical protein